MPPALAVEAQHEGDLHARVAYLEDMVQRLMVRLDDAEAGLQPEFSPYVVNTWGDMSKPILRRHVRAEISRVFREAAIAPPGAPGGGEQDDTMRSKFERFDDTLTMINPASQKSDYERALHRTVVEMTAITQFKEDTKARGYYMTKAKACKPEKFSTVRHVQLLEEAQVEQRKEWAQAHQALMTASRSTAGYTPYPAAQKGKGLKVAGKGKGSKGWASNKGNVKQGQ
eukprot:TRINITY_DN1900_c0_g1_i3.p3 TRINITY_DN1900_c0_g1~~TRINITY_DN1900_c0_g1_i3.p3  ORF type:complete len:227 (+),score=44.19 TRINITY_DN1900_c0_g1_i3:704-1384(+)